MTLYQILPQISFYIENNLDIWSLRLVNKFFWKNVPKHINILRKFIDKDISSEQILDFTQLVRSDGISFLITSPKQISQLPISLKYTSIKICDFNYLKNILARNWKYLQIKYYNWNLPQNQTILIRVRDNICYMLEKDHHLFINNNCLSDLNIRWIDDFSQEYQNLNRKIGKKIGPRILTFNRYIHYISHELGKLLNIQSGYHQHTVIELALYIFCKKHPVKTWNFNQKIILMEKFHWIDPSDELFSLPQIKTHGNNDLNIEDIEDYAVTENKLLTSLLKKIDLDDFLNVIS